MLKLTIDWKTVSVEFMGQTITAEVRPPSAEHMLILTPFMSFGGSLTKGQIAKLTKKERHEHDLEMSKTALSLQKAAAPLLDQIIRNIEGLNVNNEPVTFEMLGNEAALNPLVVQLVGESFALSTLDRQSEKNLQSPPAEKLPAGTVVDT